MITVIESLIAKHVIELQLNYCKLMFNFCKLISRSIRYEPLDGQT